MKIVMSTLNVSVLVLLRMLAVQGNLNSCQLQDNCIDFVTTKVTGDDDDLLCGTGTCEYQICATVNFKKEGCTDKAETDNIGYTCQKPNEECIVDLGFLQNKPSNSQKIEDLPNTHEQCQTVPPGGIAEFLFFDGSGACRNVEFVAGLKSCKRSTTNCAQNPAPCTWEIKAPDNCDGNGGGDPHFKTWGGRYYFYHGECDMILLTNPAFNNGMGLDLHIRTTIKDFYSLISSAALRIGSEVLEVDSEELYFNSNKVKDGQLPSSIAGYSIETDVDAKGNPILEVKLGHHKEEKIVIRRKNGFMWVDIKSPSMQNFRNSTGLLGDYSARRLKGRDGIKVYKDTSEFAEQWQVNDSDPKLFHYLRAPQYPIKCNLPDAEQSKYLRHLRTSMTRKEAEKACAHWSEEAQETCIFDVMMTGDVEMAETPF